MMFDWTGLKYYKKRRGKTCRGQLWTDSDGLKPTLWVTENIFKTSCLSGLDHRQK